jgi:hypothetical protein
VKAGDLRAATAFFKLTDGPTIQDLAVKAQEKLRQLQLKR